MSTAVIRNRRPALQPRGVAALAVCALVLGLGGPARQPVEPEADRGARSATLAGVGEAEVARVVARANPQLSARQLDRIARSVIRYSLKYGLDPELVTAVMLVESNASPGARSPKGAIGLMQVMPHMHAALGIAGNPSTVESNIEAGCMILATNIRRLGEEDGISAYFWGSVIRGVGYLERVRAARTEVRRWLRS